MKKHFIHLTKYKWWWMVLSAVLLIPGIIAIIYTSITYENHVPLKIGIDYTGGTILQYHVDKKVTNDDLAKTREALQGIGVENPYLQVLDDSGKSVISIRTKFIGKDDKTGDEVSKVIAAEYPDSELVSISSVGPTLGKELFKHSLIAVTLACLAIVAYLSIRFRFDYALAAVLGILHDILFVVGIFSILGLFYNVQIDGLFITALLTVIGFSVHDTIVVYDRIRENLRYYAKKMSFGEIVDASVNQTFARSINTSLTVLLTLGALYFFGGITTKDFVLTMLIGVAIGTYSSIFFCSILVDIWNDKPGKTAA